MKNTTVDLQNHLFLQLERLNDEELTPEELDKEISRSKAITQVASQVVENSRVMLDAMKLAEKAGVNIENSQAAKLFLKE